MARYEDGARVPASLFEVAAFQYALQVTCRSCGNVAVLDAHAVWWLFSRGGWDQALRAAAARDAVLPPRGWA